MGTSWRSGFKFGHDRAKQAAKDAAAIKSAATAAKTCGTVPAFAPHVKDMCVGSVPWHRKIDGKSEPTEFDASKESEANQ